MNNFFSLIVNTWRYRHSYCWRLETKSTWFTRALVQLLVSMSGVVSSFELPRYPPVADTTITHSVMLAPRDNKISSDNKAQISSDNQRSRGQFLQKHQDFLLPCPFACQSDEAVSQPSSPNQDKNRLLDRFLYKCLYSMCLEKLGAKILIKPWL